MLRRLFIAALVGLLCGPLNAQSFPPGFPPGMFQSRAAIDGTSSSFSGPSCVQSGAFLVRASSLSATNETNYDNLICGLVTDSNYSPLDVLWIFAAPNSATAAQNLISSSSAQITGTIAATTLTWTAVASGAVVSGQTLGDFSGNVTPGTTLSGCTGTSTGTCTVSVSQTVSVGETMYAGASTNNATLTGSPTFSAYNGYTGLSTANNYVDGPVLSGLTQFQRNSASLAVWINGNLGSTTKAALSNNGASVIVPDNAGTATIHVNESAGAMTWSQSTTAGHFMGVRTGSAAQAAYYNGVSQATSTQASVAAASTTPLIPNSTAVFQIAAAHFGSSSITESSLYSRLRTYMTAVGVP